MSEYFEKACGGSFKASIVLRLLFGDRFDELRSPQEADEAVIRLPDDPESVQRMLDFMYGQVK